MSSVASAQPIPPNPANTSTGQLHGVFVLTLHILRVKRRTLVIWSLSLATLVVLMLSIHPSVTSAIDYDALIEAYPENLKKAFGIDAGAGMNTAIGFLNAELFGLLLPLSIVFLPTGYVTRAISSAEEKGYLELLFSLPVQRWQLAVATAISAVFALAASLLAMFGAGIMTARTLGIDLRAGELARSCASLWPLATYFSAMALLVACAWPRAGRPAASAAALLVAMYLVNVVGELTPAIGGLENLSPFHYYGDWLKHGIDWVSAGTITLISVAVTIIATQLLERRDISA